MEDHPGCALSGGAGGVSWSEAARAGSSTACCINQTRAFSDSFDGGCFLFKYSFCLCKRISVGLYIPTSQDYLKALFTFSSGNCFKPCRKPSKPDMLRAETGLHFPRQPPRQEFSLGWPFWWWGLLNLSSPLTVQLFNWVGAKVTLKTCSASPVSSSQCLHLLLCVPQPSAVSLSIHVPSVPSSN